MLVKTSKHLLILIIILITGCSENKVEKIDNIRLNEKLAEELVSLSVKCVDKKYPYKIFKKNIGSFTYQNLEIRFF